ncbi:MAG: metallophosphoesterase, partial [Planctomycetota bacterium]
MSTFQILHISDLHVSAQGNFDRSVVLGPLISRVEVDINAGFKPEIVVVTGDIANAGVNAEY